MRNLSLIRKVASLLLLICFVLPLSKCESAKEPVTESAEKPVTAKTPVKETSKDSVYVDGYLYPYKLAQQGLNRIQEGTLGFGMLDLLEIVIVFFLPFILLFVREKPQTIITAVASVFVGFPLFFWVFFWGNPEWGGILAVICWIVLLAISLITLFQWWRQRKSHRLQGLA
ncbi:hypothetical protein H8L32_10365 [Undibacterium sp. CY18W]|uniref:Uncharacterized protein n=1 Tax=Undibacterium hunanense TaxID=2762292 RepID=A0ABR6ZPT5_9BURK|nr:hypothetical protein [Undibacterium hunanense]MBC3917877.1 hypothetical protein [Undibacterium hunanense]